MARPLTHDLESFTRRGLPAVLAAWLRATKTPNRSRLGACDILSADLPGLLRRGDRAQVPGLKHLSRGNQTKGIGRVGTAQRLTRVVVKVNLFQAG